jgi:hypothetical protein
MHLHKIRTSATGPLVRINYMSPSSKGKDDRMPDDLQEVADMLHHGRPRLDPLTFDRVKLRAMSGMRQSTSQRHKGSFMRSRLTTFVTAAFLAVGTGGALALSGGGGVGPAGGSASRHQYRPPPPCPPGFVQRDHHCIPEKHH